MGEAARTLGTASELALELATSIHVSIHPPLPPLLPSLLPSLPPPPRGLWARGKNEKESRRRGGQGKVISAVHTGSEKGRIRAGIEPSASFAMYEIPGCSFC